MEAKDIKQKKTKCQDPSIDEVLSQAESLLNEKRPVDILADMMMENYRLQQQIDDLKEQIMKPKNLLTLKEAADFLGFSQSYTYKMVHDGMLPCFKPFGKVIYFERAELEAVLRTNRMATVDEITSRANGYLMSHPM